MDAPKCRTCGERHRTGPCPKFESSRGLGKAAGRTGNARKPDEGTPRPREPESKKRTGVKALGSRGPKPGSGGRPRIGSEGATLKDQQPWKAEGVSQATWYRRQKEKRE